MVTVHLVRQHPLEVGGEPAAGDVRHGVGLRSPPPAPGRPWRRSGSARAAPRRGCGPSSGTSRSSDQPGGGQQDVADQGVAVGVQAAGLHRDHDVAGSHQAGPEQPVGLHDAGGRAGDVVLVGAEQAGVLGGLAADERAAGLDARLGDALDDGGDPLGYDAAGGDVVGEEQRLGAADDEVVDEHPDQVEADGVVLVEGLGDRDLGADAVGGGREQRPVVGLEGGGVEEPGEAADAADHLGPAGLLDPLLHQLDGAVPGLDRDAGCGVGVVGAGHGSREGGSSGGHGLLRMGSASVLIDCSSRCLPSRDSSGSGIGYSPVKQAWQRWSAVWPVESIMLSSEM